MVRLLQSVVRVLLLQRVVRLLQRMVMVWAVQALAGNCRGGGVQVSLIAVHPRWQRRGVGKQLLQLLQSRRLGGDPMTLLTCSEHSAVSTSCCHYSKVLCAQ